MDSVVDLVDMVIVVVDMALVAVVVDTELLDNALAAAGRVMVDVVGIVDSLVVGNRLAVDTVAGEQSEDSQTDCCLNRNYFWGP